MPSSFTTDLPDHILIDSAIILYDPVTPGAMVKLGATRGGATFRKNREIRHVEFDGMSGEVEGLHRYTTGTPTIEGTFLLLSPATLETIIEPGSTSDYTAPSPVDLLTVTPLAFRTMFPTSAYHRYELLWKRGNGGTAAIVFPKGLAVVDEIGSQDNNEGEMPLIIRAVNAQADIDGLDEVPAPYYYELDGDDITVPSA